MNCLKSCFRRQYCFMEKKDIISIIRRFLFIVIPIIFFGMMIFLYIKPDSPKEYYESFWKTKLPENMKLIEDYHESSFHGPDLRYTVYKANIGTESMKFADATPDNVDGCKTVIEHYRDKIKNLPDSSACSMCWSKETKDDWIVVLFDESKEYLYIFMKEETSF